MSTQSVRRRPTKRELIKQARAKQQPEEVETVTPPIAPPEPSIAEIAEAMDAPQPMMMDEYEPESDDWFADPIVDMDDTLEEPDYMRGRIGSDTSGEQAPSPPSPQPLHAPVPRLVTSSSGVLIAHCGTRKITRDELARVPTPKATRTHQPVAHSRIVELLEETLAFRCNAPLK